MHLLIKLCCIGQESEFQPFRIRTCQELGKPQPARAFWCNYTGFDLVLCRTPSFHPNYNMRLWVFDRLLAGGLRTIWRKSAWKRVRSLRCTVFGTKVLSSGVKQVTDCGCSFRQGLRNQVLSCRRIDSSIVFFHSYQDSGTQGKW